MSAKYNSPTDSLVDLLGRGVMRVLSPGGTRGLSILIYHRVLPRKDPLFPDEVDRDEFDFQMGLVKSCFNVISLIDAVRHTRAGTLPPRAACITFDDGYADNAEIALPILQKHGLHATFFVATGFLNGGRMWNDTLIELVRHAPGETVDAACIGLGTYPVATIEQKQAAIRALIGKLKYVPFAERVVQVNRLAAEVGSVMSDDLMMNTAQLQTLHRAGMEIGAHTVNHPILACIAPDEARQEIARGKAELEAMIGDTVRVFAYPNGKPHDDYLKEHVDIVKSLGFEGAVSTAWGAGKAGGDIYQLPRFTPWDRSAARFVMRLAKNLTAPADAV